MTITKVSSLCLSEKVRRELEDLILFLMMPLLCSLCWFLFLGWQWDSVLPSHDAMFQSLPWIHDLIEHQRVDWGALLYRSRILGGVPLFSSYGSLPLIRLLTRLPLAEGSIINLHYLLLQSLFGFWTMRSCIDIKQLSIAHTPPTGDKRYPFYPCVLFFGIIGAFAPVVWWRVVYGHSSILAALLVIPATLGIGLGTLRGRLSLVSMLIGVFCSSQASQGHGYQILLYSAIFGGPLILVALWSLTPRGSERFILMQKTAVVLTVVIGSGLLLSSPMIYVMLQSAMEGDTVRGPHSDLPIIYSYIVSTVGDWLSSLTWSHLSFLSEREDFYWHETNYPIGPLIVFFLPWLRSKIFFAVNSVVILLLLVFSCKIEPFASIMLQVVPPLTWFRVPARAALPIVIFIGMMACGRLFSMVDQSPHRDVSPRYVPWVILIALCLVLWTTEPLTREMILWGAALGVSIIRPPQRWTIAAAALLAFGCLMVNKERVLPYWSANQLISLNHKLGKEIIAKAPELSSPLHRAMISSDDLIIGGPHGPYLAGISTLDGYMVPTSRFGQLLEALNGRPIPSGIEIFHVASRSPEVEILMRLYNVCTNVSLKNNELQIQKEHFCAGPAWLSQRLELMPNMAAIGSHLMAGGAEQERLRSLAVALSEDEQVTEALFASPAQACHGGTLGFMQSDSQKHVISLWEPTKGTCYFTLAVNFSDILKGRVMNTAGVWAKAETFPIYGSLLGLELPPDTAMIIIEAKADSTPWLPVFPWIGIFCLLVILSFYVFKPEIILEPFIVGPTKQAPNLAPKRGAL